MITDRRRFLAATGVAFGGLLIGGQARATTGPMAQGSPVGPLRPDPEGVLDLPQGFSYRVISRLGDAMSDGGTVPDRADGMGCFDLGAGKLALVRNHELQPQHDGGEIPDGPAFDRIDHGVSLPGGTTTLVLDAATLEVEREYRSLAGTIRNCAGGITPWNSWLTCEENTTTMDQAGGRLSQDHGWIFEIPAAAPGLVEPRPLTAMGRFNHEAACVDPRSGIVYLTEDREDSVLYRFIPNAPGELHRGGKLQAMALFMDGITDTRNWNGANMAVGQTARASWIDMDIVEAPDDDLRHRAAARGAALIARGEGIWMGDGEMYLTATSGGAANEGQIFRLRPGRGDADAFSLFYESPAEAEYSFGDNIVVGPNGHLVVCEDSYKDHVENHLRGITPTGEAYALALLNMQTELAGACFSPDGRTMFVNAYSPTMTLAITGPWPT
ncbi:alkaline phosphatase PhoX [Aurantiacibacter aquimixticola]|uniref:DUF839 domain-containing protein n=1 Tax=Aurantiacibacter aquimixticola TaxID=1958945 RepID=A0A419RVU6_9SPHN|nr:alkaline phosphatase PhoX [Aurantiacibacter aquimixticola]RJY09912.1 DUF839 domain-containing protein [Aurantiacibacter aquimixticola]